MSYDYGWKPYVPVAERRAKAEKAAAKAKKAGSNLTPIASFRGAIAKTFWGKAWCENLENYSDYENRLPRGRTYVRNGSVIDLRIAPGEVSAQVMGSSLYKVSASVTALPAPQWKTICTDCTGSIDSLVELLQGKLSSAVMTRLSKPGSGLFPAPREIKFRCSCPDGAYMCKHVAAVLYGIGARLDAQPELLFKLRQVEVKDLVDHAGAGLTPAGQGPAKGKVLDEALLADVFGLEMAETTQTPAAPVPLTVAAKAPATRKAPVPKEAAAKKTPKPAVPASAQPPVAVKTVAARKKAASPTPVKPAASPRKAAAPATKAARSPAALKTKTVATRQPVVGATKKKPA
jgi:uncharacterized Zn finger protein